MAKRVSKKCKKHGVTLHVYEGSTKHLRCMKCRAERVAKHRRDRKNSLVALFGGKCIICGYDKHPAMFDFHHIDPETKEFGISNGNCYKLDVHIKEAKKCVLLCCRCHREVELGITNIPTAR